MYTDRSKDPFRLGLSRREHWLLLLAGMAWLSGAAVSADWMLHDGGLIWPFAIFAMWAAAVILGIMRIISEHSNTAVVKRQIFLATRYGVYSMIALALGTLFLEYWPVTVSMAFMFAICRAVKTEDNPAYI